ncbi:MAG: 5-(carboxyamino)imidazole ribonucleotide mutase [Candidatus Methanomethylicota archaeon]|uniref:N5-carboxyaminoimidazole ribonucleotide mutase n=1 Tax=Thermoproteota archaeon TaxID=2056631 RepID=A0A497ERM2_9CREN|nr:MAG: 5-(carboxyamino)imidazole ribonucleotide mutase [Candidatus Verstraetearchaeota archaeon]
MVSLIIGSERDREVGDKVFELLKSFGVNVEYRVMSAHRNPKELDEYVTKTNAEVFIAIAGLSAALPGVIASKTLKPVIGVPREVKVGGLDSLLSIAQMPPGVPVACVGIDNGENAALLAISILSLRYPELEDKLAEYRRSRAEKSIKVIS